VTDEAGTELRTFIIGERLTPHVRHRQKYVDVPVPDNRAFVFGAGRRSVTARAHTLREFVEVLEKLGVTQGSGYLRRRDFSRWIGDVFGDHALARELEGHERRYAREEYPDALGQIADAIRTRYDLTDASDAQTVQDSGAVVTERVRL
jgi:hypothetical protein